MKVVIDIPEELFNIAKDGMLNEIQSMFICGSVSQGTPLPKGHGDLVDRNSILCTDFPCDLCAHADECFRLLAPTIIEAERNKI